MRYAVFETDWGWVGVATSDAGLCAVVLPQPTAEAARERLLAVEPTAREVAAAELGDLSQRLQRYLRGEAVGFDDTLDTSGIGPFHLAVYERLREVPRGQVITYGALARAAGRWCAARAVGQAMARNPWPIVVPCHRVIGSDGGLTGFGGGLELKRRLLALEGASLPGAGAGAAGGRPSP